MNQTTKNGNQPESGSKWKTVLIVIAVIVFFLWASSGESGDGSDCTRLGNGAEWGADC
jgi:ABC-type phosphate/phosphonate transport system permease subunit